MNVLKATSGMSLPLKVPANTATINKTNDTIAQTFGSNILLFRFLTEEKKQNDNKRKKLFKPESVCFLNLDISSCSVVSEEEGS